SSRSGGVGGEFTGSPNRELQRTGCSHCSHSGRGPRALDRLRACGRRRPGMALTEIQRAQVTKRLTAFCGTRVPAAARNKIRVGFRVSGSEVVLFEERPAFQPPHEWREMVVAKFKYVGTQGRW